MRFEHILLLHGVRENYKNKSPQHSPGAQTKLCTYNKFGVLGDDEVWEELKNYTYAFTQSQEMSRKREVSLLLSKYETI